MLLVFAAVKVMFVSETMFVFEIDKAEHLKQATAKEGFTRFALHGIDWRFMDNLNLYQ